MSHVYSLTPTWLTFICLAPLLVRQALRCPQLKLIINLEDKNLMLQFIVNVLITLTIHHTNIVTFTTLDYSITC